MAVTGQEAAEAIKEGKALANQLAAAQKLQGQELEQEVAVLKQTVDPSNIPAALKASLRDQLAGLQKKVLEGQKKASAANKQRATQVGISHILMTYLVRLALCISILLIDHMCMQGLSHALSGLRSALISLSSAKRFCGSFCESAASVAYTGSSHRCCCQNTSRQRPPVSGYCINTCALSLIQRRVK